MQGITNSENKGMYVPEMEHDACGIGFVANLKGKKSHQIIEDALAMLMNMEHRGGTGAEPDSGDGAGILIQMPHSFFVKECRKENINLPEFGEYGVGMIFFPSDETVHKECRKVLNSHIQELGFELLGYRKVPVNNETLGTTAKNSEPVTEQVFVRHKTITDTLELERKLFVLKKYTANFIKHNVDNNNGDFYFVSISYKTIVYKGQFTTEQVLQYYPDLSDPEMETALALVHARFSTNTFPKWKLAQPFKYIAHNGEINSIRGNLNWMGSNEALLESAHFSREDMERLLPICDMEHSDSANLDRMIELLVLGGRSMAHVMMMMIPEAWQENKLMDAKKREFYAYHASIMEPWDGPASVCFTDGNIVGATLDRNGLRPSRYCLTDNDTLIMASEAGALPVDPAKIVMKNRLQPGKIFIADLSKGKIISDEELKKEICSSQPYGKWLEENSTDLKEIPLPHEPTFSTNDKSLIQLQLAMGMKVDDLKMLLVPMAVSGKEPIGSMGADIPLAVLSNQSQHLSNYFKQLFAQVSNPPIDPIRERIIMSLQSSFGPNKNILNETPEHCRQICVDHPVLLNEDMDKLRYIEVPHYKSKEIDITFNAHGGNGSLERAIYHICKKAENAVRYGINILILSDRKMSAGRAPIPSLLATGAVHHHLIRQRLRVRSGLVVEAGDVWESHHFATLLGFGASAVNPYLALETITGLQKNDKLQNLSKKEVINAFTTAINAGLLKIFSKMGISTLQSYQGAQIFEAVGLNQRVINKCFHRTVSRIHGIDYNGIAREVISRHKLAYPKDLPPMSQLVSEGKYQWSRRGEKHLFNPESISLLQQATQTNNPSIFKAYSDSVNNQDESHVTIRSLLEFDFEKANPVPLDEVESVESIFKRFSTGAMSFGSISHEAHSTLAIAMNRIGGKSNSGEGGEDPVRFEPKENGDWERSAIKQVASGRFGVTSYYLTNADELQIKIAQGAKPGEGGQLPGHKVDDWIGRVRYSTPGVGLISPPPHHDIYSIEDLAQLIFDLKNANREARINVKLVAETGVGTIAAGVAKAKADVILISGYDGGTGASPLSSIYHAGLPWEFGLSEAHQTLVKNRLRDRIVLQTDGKIKTGRDLAIATLLGAEEWGVATASLVTIGCVMMRKCHLNTCPVGVATQNPELRKMFTGKPEYVINLFHFLAQELREIMASLGLKTVNEMVGRTDLLKQIKTEYHPNWKLRKLTLKKVLYKEPANNITLYNSKKQDHHIDDVLDWKILELARDSLEKQSSIKGSFDIVNTDRAVGAIVSNEISKKYNGEGLPAGSIHIQFRGSAGQSFGAFGARGLFFELEGEANDYFGKGLSGAQLIVYPDRKVPYDPGEFITIGNVAFYGATSGDAYIRGKAGERFCVRNSGVKAVVEGVGDHGCEYMTGGIVVVLGKTGRNFAAGMSGGIAYVYDLEENFIDFCNTESIDIDPLEESDFEILNNMLTRHVEFTRSDIAENILTNWENEITRFKKVMPVDYKRAMMNKHLEEGIKTAV